MVKESLSSKVTSSLLWKFFERGSVQVMQLVVALIIARILGPDEYGSVALLTIFISIATVFVQSGLNTAIIQKKDADDIDISSVFYYSLVLAFILYGLLFFMAEPIANFYEMPRLKDMLRVLALMLFPGALNSIQLAVLAKKMQFRTQFFSSFFSVILSGGLGITMAVLGSGAWALITQQLSYQIFVCVLLWFLLKWRPKLVFSFQKTKGLLKFGGKLLGARLIDTLYNNLIGLITGKRYSEQMLAFYNKGKQFPALVVDNIDGALQSVMLPVFSDQQKDIEKVKCTMRKTISHSTYLVFPTMIGLLIIAKPMIQIILGDAWLGSVPILQIFCLIFMVTPILTTSLQAINACGNSGVYFLFMSIKRIVGVISLIVALLVSKDILAMLWATLIVDILSAVVMVCINKHYFNYSLKELLNDISSNFLITLLMSILTVSIGEVFSDVWLKLIVQCLSGVGIYIFISVVCRNNAFLYILDKTKKIFKKGRI